MKVTVSMIKADVGSVGGHAQPHPQMFDACRTVLSIGVEKKVINDFHVTRVGDDINLLMVHEQGEDSPKVHALAWDAFQAATKVAKELQLYAAGQDILSDAFSGNIRGMGPGAAEMTFEARKSEPMLFFMADKTEPSAFTLPLTRIFLDPFTTTGLLIDTRMRKGFEFEVVDVMESMKVDLNSPEETYDILTLLSDTTRYAIKRITSREPGVGPAAVLSTEKLNVTAGKYVGKDDPACLFRSQGGLPAVGEILQPFMFPILVAGWCRGSHYGAWYPCSVEDSSPTYFDGPPRIVALSMQVTNGRFQGMEPKGSPPGEHAPVDLFAGSCWDGARTKAVEVCDYIRRHGPIMPGVVPPEEMEYTTRPEVMKRLLPRLKKVK